MKPVALSVVALLLASQNAFSQVAAVGVAPAPPPNSLAVDGQYFDASVSGVRELVETYRDSDPDLYAKLTIKADKLAAMKTRAWVVGIGTAAVGLGAVVAGFALYKPTGGSQPPNTTPVLALKGHSARA